MKTAIIFNDSGWQITRRTMGAYKVAHMMRSYGWNVEVVDWITKWKDTEILEFLGNCKKIDLIGFGNLWLEDSFVKDKIALIKKNYPTVKFILGSPKPYQQDFGADVMIFGYSEHALKPVLDWMFDNGEKPKGKYPSWAPNSYLIDANHLYPALQIGSYDVEYQDNDFVLPTDVLTLEMTRGCRFRCKYCSYAFLGVKEDYSRCEESIYHEMMDNYNKWGTVNYVIADDTFNDRDIKIERLANVVKRLPFQPNFSAFIRLDLVLLRPKQLQLLIDARVWAHFYGIETLHPEAAKAIGKGMHPSKIKDGLLSVRESFRNALGLYRGTCGMIAGLPFEPIESWHESLEWMDKNWECYLFWALHISTDKDIQTHSDFSIDAKKYGYNPTEDVEMLSWAEQQGLLDIHSENTHKLDRHIMIWEADWANFKDASEFATMYNKNYFPKIKVPNFELLNYWNYNNFINFTAQDAYIDAKFKTAEDNMIKEYIFKKLKNEKN